MAVTQVRVVSVPVGDQDRAKTFYVETLGFELLADSPMGPEQRWVQVGPRGGQTSLTLVTWFDTMPPGSLRGVVLECDDLRATRDQLAASGVVFNQEIEEQPWGTFTTFDDPDGNGFVLQQSTPGA
jgi:catechol 2,3-dioxygenase-like lactoylglutathione lyase family enzyme